MISRPFIISIGVHVVFTLLVVFGMPMLGRDLPEEMPLVRLEVVRTVPEDGADPLATMRALGQHWGPHADFVWWGDFGEITSGSTDFGRLVRLQYLEYIGDEGPDDRPVEGDEVDDLLRFMRVYPY